MIILEIMAFVVTALEKVFLGGLIIAILLIVAFCSSYFQNRNIFKRNYLLKTFVPNPSVEKDLAGIDRTKNNLLTYSFGLGWVLIIILTVSAVVPWGNSIHLFGQSVDLQMASVNVDVLFIIGLLSTGILGIMTKGIDQRSPYLWTKVIRSASLVVCYELSVGFSIAALLMVSGTMSMKGIVDFQKDADWNFIYQPFGFILFLAGCIVILSYSTGVSQNNQQQHQHEDVAKFERRETGLSLFVRQLVVTILSVLTVSFYFAGYDIPFVSDVKLRNSIGLNPTAIIEGIVLLAKTIAIIFLFSLAGKRVRNIKYLQLMNFGWKVLLPLNVLNMAVTGIILLIQ